MTTADRITLIRVVLSPLFFVLFFLPQWLGIEPVALSVIALWAVFAVIEVTDLLDGMVARATNTVSDFGKLFDPFADTLARLTYFLCFALIGEMHPIFLLVILYREFGVLFLRNRLALRGVAMGARPGGKAKAVVYMVAGIVALAWHSFSALSIYPGVQAVLAPVSTALFALAALAALASFVDYLFAYRRIISSKAGE
jgi:CDP-diacylglycerol---glycerol-3-phosphate 3-phosphatidyltransferase